MINDDLIFKTGLLLCWDRCICKFRRVARSRKMVLTYTAATVSFSKELFSHFVLAVKASSAVYAQTYLVLLLSAKVDVSAFLETP